MNPKKTLVVVDRFIWNMLSAEQQQQVTDKAIVQVQNTRSFQPSGLTPDVKGMNFDKVIFALGTEFCRHYGDNVQFRDSRPGTQFIDLKQFQLEDEGEKSLSEHLNVLMSHI